jgi:hypothetical protein
MEAATTSVIEARGVYWARHTKRGRPVLYAVSSTGDVVKHLVLRHDRFADAAIEYLWTHLERTDPPRKLELVKSVEPQRVDIHPDEDERRYRRFLVKRGAAAIGFRH